jgi:hypothetical protein
MCGPDLRAWARGVLPHARPSGTVNGSQPTVTIADKYKPGVLIETSERRRGGQ